MDDKALQPGTWAQASPNAYLQVLRERKWMVIACTVLVFAATAVITYRTTPRYQTTATLLRQDTSIEYSLFGTDTFRTNDVPREMSTVARTVKTAPVAERVKAELDTTLSVDDLIYMVDAKSSPDADTIAITAVSTSPQLAADVANSFAEQSIAIRRDSDRQSVAAARRVVQAQLDSMSEADKASEKGLLLSQRLEQLLIVEELQTGGYTLWQRAEVPKNPFSPRPVANGAMGLGVGLLLGLVIAFSLEFLDRRIKDVSGFERSYGLPVLASVPVTGRRWKGRGANGSLNGKAVGFTKPHSPTLEAYRALRSSLEFFSAERPIRAIMVTSGRAEEGKTVTSINLALALAMTGKRVILIDTDLRSPSVHGYLRLGNSMGLSNVLAGIRTFSEVLQRVAVDEFLPPQNSAGSLSDKIEAQRQRRYLYCVTSGPLPPNPAELLGSGKTGDILNEALELADYVVVDTPPVLVVADALGLSSHVDAVVIASRVRRTTVDQARGVVTLLQRAGARAIGVVANGTKDRESYRYESHYYGR